MSRTHQEAATCRLRTKAEARTKIAFDVTARGKLSACGSMVGYLVHMISTLTPQFIFISNLLWLKRNLCVEHPSDAALSFIQVLNNQTNPTYINHMNKHPTGLASQVVL